MENNHNKNMEDLQFDNEFRKLKLSAETGAIFSGSGQLPPDLEKEWLDYIEYFNREDHDREITTVYDFIGRPSFEKNVPDEKIEEALDDLLNYMYNNNVQLSTLTEVPAQRLYSFIIEELFLQEVDNFRVKDMHNCFIYEEFHPNHEYNMKHSCEQFFHDLFKGDFDFQLTVSFSDSFKAVSGKPVTEKQLKYIFECFCLSYGNIELKKLSFGSVDIKEERAVLHVDIDWEGDIKSANVRDHYSGTGVVEFIYEYGFWYICGINVPGLVI